MISPAKDPQQLPQRPADTIKVVDQMEITNDKQYLEALARLVAGAEYIEADDFKRLPLWKQEQARKRYDEIEHAILKYQGTT